MQGSPLNVISKARTEKIAEKTSCRLVITLSMSSPSITVTKIFIHILTITIIHITITSNIHITITTLRLVSLSCPDSSHSFTASACCEGGVCFLEHGKTFQNILVKFSRIFWQYFSEYFGRIFPEYFCNIFQKILVKLFRIFW